MTNRRGGSLSPSAVSRSITSSSGARPWMDPARKRPMPRLSIRSVAVCGRSRNGTLPGPCPRSTQTPSSQMSSAPSAMSSSASVDFPVPDAPQIITPLPSKETALAWKWRRWGSGASAQVDNGTLGAADTRSSDRQADDEARAQRFRYDVKIGRTDVFRPDHAAMRFHDLL